MTDELKNKSRQMVKGFQEAQKQLAIFETHPQY